MLTSTTITAITSQFALCPLPACAPCTSRQWSYSLCRFYEKFYRNRFRSVSNVSSRRRRSPKTRL